VARSQYFADSSEFEDEQARLKLSQSLYDDHSRRSVLRTGIRKGWTCLELGAGGGSMTRWLSEQVGKDGKVVAVDLNCRFLQDLDLENVEVREADIAVTDLERDSFDLVFSRFVLLHVADRAAALSKLLSAVKPGGWIVLVDADFSTLRALNESDPRSEEFDTVFGSEVNYLTETNMIDCFFGRKLFGLLKSAGLEDVGGEGFCGVHVGGSEGGRYYFQSRNHNRAMYVEAGVVTEDEFDATSQQLMDPTFVFTDATIFSFWGRKSAGNS
jgi:ubiquinone/menaquinone biosynthesis C-methylase UbiE